MLSRASLVRGARLLPLGAFVALGGCFATRNDVRLVQSDLASMRTELLKANAEQAASLQAAMRTLAVASDSVRVMSNRLTTVQGDVRGGLRAVNDQLIQVQELLRQSASAIAKVRADNEERFNRPLVAPPAAAGAPGMPGAPVDTAMGAAMPQTQSGPNVLYRDGVANLNRGSTSTARNTFQELLNNYPNSELAPQAQLGIGQSFYNEKNFAAAIPAFAAVVAKYPDSPQAPTALYKNANIYHSQGRDPEAKTLLQQIITKYRGSDEFDFATEMLKTLK